MINIKFHGFIFFEILFKFKLTLLNLIERISEVVTPINVAISIKGSSTNFFKVKSRNGATRIIPKGISSFFKENGSVYVILPLTFLTKNIYPKYSNKSHHLGITENKYGNYNLTAGLHVHFSNRDNEGNIIQLPIEDIVKQMDEVFVDIINEANRIPGEYEKKIHGFEYRSLPCNADVHEVLKESFRILRRI